MTQAINAILPSAFAQPPDVIDPTGHMVGWWTDPPGVVLQFARPTRGTTKMAEWLVETGGALLGERFPDMTDLYVVLDMRQMTGRSALARSILIQQAPSFGKQLGQLVLLPSVHLGPAYVKVVEGTAILLRLAGLRVEVESSLERVLSKHGLRAATPPPLGSPASRSFISRRV